MGDTQTFTLSPLLDPFAGLIAPYHIHACGNGWEYLTDAILIARVADRESRRFDGQYLSGRILTVSEIEVLPWAERDGDIPIPAVTSVVSKCALCDGKRFNYQPCPACDRKGHVSHVSDCGFSFDHDCYLCDGRSVVSFAKAERIGSPLARVPCADCNGTGETTDDIMISGWRFAGPIINLLVSLGATMNHLPPVESNNTMLRWFAGDVDGLVISRERED